MTKAPEAMKPSREERARDFKASLSGAARIMVETENAIGEYDVQTFKPDEVTALYIRSDLAEALEAENQRLRATLSAITATDCYSRDECTAMARAALNNTEANHDD